MIVIERRYKTLNSQRTYYVDIVERRAFEDNDLEGVREFIKQEGDFKYIKL